ncbi:hypothetical protein EMIT0158MI4_30557 [Burkholderia ambifaria]
MGCALNIALSTFAGEFAHADVTSQGV